MCDSFFDSRHVKVHIVHMSEIDEKVRKARERYIRYNQTPDRKESRQIASALRSHQQTLVTTMKRIQSHEFDDLVEVARMCCQDDPNRFSVNQDIIMKALIALRGGNVQSGEPSLGICPPRHSSD